MSAPLSPRVTAATVRRVLVQLRHDPRTVALLIVVPSLLMVLLRYVFGSDRVFDDIAPALLGFFPFLMMFLITSVTMLRERAGGTIERLFTLPLARLDLLVGDGIAFALVAVVQVVAAVLVSLALGLDIAGSIGAMLVIAVLNALLGVAFGLLASAFARTEFQALQFMPLIVLPQFLLCGLLVDRDDMALVLQWVSDVMPLSYAVEALQQVTSHPTVDGTYWRAAAVVLGCVLLGLALAPATLRRRTD